MPEHDWADAVVAGIAAARWNARVALIRKIPEEFGKAQHQAVYAAVATAVYVSDLVPDFAYVHWRDEYELEPIARAYERAFALTSGFTAVAPATLAGAMAAEPATVRIFRLLLPSNPRPTSSSTTSTRLYARSSNASRPTTEARHETRPRGSQPCATRP